MSTRSRAAIVALGGNLGDPAATLRSAARSLGSIALVERASSLYRTEPVGGAPGQPSYVNAVVLLRPYPLLDEPHALLAALLVIERVHGRVRRERWGARTLDLDLLDLEGTRLADEALTLPHPRMMDRPFVLAPLCELAPDWRHPATGELACDALARQGAEGVVRTELAWASR